MGPGMSPDATESSTFGRPVTRALSQDVQEALEAAEDRGFEPRRAARPNRISSPFRPTKDSESRPNPPQSAQLSSGGGKAAEPGARRRNPFRASIVPAMRTLVPVTEIGRMRAGDGGNFKREGKPLVFTRPAFSHF